MCKSVALHSQGLEIGDGVKVLGRFGLLPSLVYLIISFHTRCSARGFSRICLLWNRLCSSDRDRVVVATLSLDCHIVPVNYDKFPLWNVFLIIAVRISEASICAAYSAGCKLSLIRMTWYSSGLFLSSVFIFNNSPNNQQKLETQEIVSTSNRVVEFCASPQGNYWEAPTRQITRRCSQWQVPVGYYCTLWYVSTNTRPFLALKKPELKNETSNKICSDAWYTLYTLQTSRSNTYLVSWP